MLILEGWVFLMSDVTLYAVAMLVLIRIKTQFISRALGGPLLGTGTLHVLCAADGHPSTSLISISFVCRKQS